MKSGKIFLSHRMIFFRKKEINIFFALVISTAFLLPQAFAANDIQQIAAENERQLIKQANKLTRRGEYTEAEKILRRIIENNPQNAKTKLALAFNLLKQRRILDSYNLAFEVAKKDSGNSNAFALLGVALLSAGEFNDARAAFHDALFINKKEALAWAGLGTLNFYENRLDKGLDYLRKAVYLEPFEADYLFILGQVAARAENYNEAADSYNRFLSISAMTDSERRERIKGLISFLRYLGSKQILYKLEGEEETSVSFSLTNDRPVIRLRINKEKEFFNFVLDTGSGISVISNETAKKLGLRPIARGGKARAIGGEGKFEIVYGFLRDVGIGGVKIKNVPVYIREFHSKNEKIDGYIGLSLISKFLTTIDYGNSQFSLKKTSAAASAEENSLYLPLRITSGGYLSGEVQLEGIEAPLNFIVDTGASISVISDELAETKELSRFLRAEKMRVVGAAGVTEDVPSFLLPRVTFGKHSRESIKAIALDLDVINETAGFEQRGILGGNFLKNYRLTFDFANSKVIFDPLGKDK